MKEHNKRDEGVGVGEVLTIDGDAQMALGYCAMKGTMALNGVNVGLVCND